MLRDRLLSLALAFTCLASAASAPVSARADAPVPLDYKAYDSWNSIRTPKLSDDGRYLAYALTPEDGDPTLVVRDLAGTSEQRETRGAAPQFAASGRFVVFTHVAPKKDVDAAKKAKKPASEQPKDGLGILATGGTVPAEIVDRVQSVKVAWNAGPVIAYRLEPPPSPSPSAAPKAVASPSASPLPAPTGVWASAPPSPLPSPAPSADKTKDTGAPFVIRDLVSGTKVAVNDVTAYAIADGDDFVAYATETKDGTGDGLHLYDVARGTTSDVLVGAGRYRNLAFARDGSSLAFLSDVATYANPVPSDAAYLVDLRAAKPRATKVVDGSTAGMPANTAPSANGTLEFSRDGKRLFLGTAAAPTPLPSGTPEPMKVDIWTWHDDVLQSQQKHDADQERKRTYLAVYDVASARFAQLGSPTLEEIRTNQNAAVGLGIDERPYRRASSWLGQGYYDLYAVALSDGSRRKLAARAGYAELSPSGTYVAAWDERSRHWFTVRTADGRRVELGRNAGVRFDLEDDDHPAPPQPYGFGGWLADDRALFYDRYDIWSADPATGAATNLTRGAGRRTKAIFSPLQTDPEATAFASDKPLLLSLFNERSFASGYAQVATTGGVPTTLLELDEIVSGERPVFSGGLHDLGQPPLKARNAGRYLFSRETFRNFPNLWTADGSFHDLAQVTDANPQQARYRWGTERLISYTADDGTPLRAVLLVPDGLKPERKAPLLVYFYERWSDLYHAYYRPAPGTSPNFTRYVSNGYVVLLPDVHYLPGHPGNSAVGSILPAVDAAIRTGYVDPSRMGIAGHSWAAYQINYLITKTHRFRAAEAGAAVDDMASAYGGIRLESGVVREGQYEHGQSRIGAAPWERPDLYFENSGLYGIKNITTPYLTIHNDMDGAVPQFQGIEFITAMRRLGKEAYLFSFDGEDHNLRGREQQKFWTVHLDEYFDYWLKGAPRPSWMDGVDYLHRGERDVRPLYGEPD